MEKSTETTTEVKPMSALRGKEYTKLNGSIVCGDDVSTALAGVELEALIKFAKANGVDTDKYAHLNNGQKRMNIGNRLRNLVKKGEVELAALTKLQRAPVKEKPAKAEKPAEAKAA